MKRNAEIRFKILELAHKMERDAFFAVCQDLDRTAGESKRVVEHLPLPEEILATAEVLAEFVFADEECCDFGEDPCDFGEMIENEE